MSRCDGPPLKWIMITDFCRVWAPAGDSARARSTSPRVNAFQRQPARAQDTAQCESIAVSGKARFVEEAPIVLSDRDRQQFFQALDRPPKPNAALRRLVAGKAKKRG